MQEYLPIIIIVAIIGTFSLIFIAAYAALKKHNIVRSEERNMADGELIRRLVGYALPFWKDFVLVLVIMIFSVVYDVISPKIIGNIEEMVKVDFILGDLFRMVLIYGGILVVCIDVEHGILSFGLVFVLRINSLEDEKIAFLSRAFHLPGMCRGVKFPHFSCSNYTVKRRGV